MHPPTFGAFSYYLMRGIIGGGSCCADGTGFFVSSNHKRMFIGAFFKYVFMLSHVPLVYAGVADYAPKRPTYADLIHENPNCARAVL